MENQTYETQLINHLLERTTQAGLLAGTLLNSPDIDEKWQEFAPSFFADAVREFNQYPEFALACAGYLGMAVATLWDGEWTENADKAYSCFQGERGFDDMDDYICDNILKDREYPSKAMKLCSYAAYSFLMKSGVESGSVEAYRHFISTADAMFKIGAAIQLHHFGYKFEKIQ